MEAQISQLLSKYAELNEVQLAPSSDDWAADIWQRTHGHRGLTIVCGVELDALIFHSVQAREAPVQLDRWREYAATELPHAARRRPTVSRYSWICSAAFKPGMAGSSSWNCWRWCIPLRTE